MGIERNVIMKLKAKLVTVGFVIILAGSIVDATAGQPASPSRSKVIFGVVRDIACPLQNNKSTARDFNLDCALACARNGAPFGILTPEGKIFIPISDKMPDVDQRSRLMPYVGKYVRGSGDIYERGGSHSIMIKTIKEDPSVRLNKKLSE